MRDIAKDAYETCETGAETWIRPDPARGETVESFQSTLLEIEAMRYDGKLHILEVHREDQTARRMVDAVRVQRLR